ncbi:P protein [Drosophila eugracilis]|uniref:P protein n=1 Tax=Drosophila eugracilis TaxID=29029 RepID=UPI0007E66404|nr:P protein [Drosophila eugracilis]
MNSIQYTRKRVSSPQTTSDYVFLIIKMSILVALWAIFTFVLLTYGDEVDETSMVTVLPNKTVYRTFEMKYDSVGVSLQGAFNPYLTKHWYNASGFTSIGVRLEWRNTEMNVSYLRTDRWDVYMSKDRKRFVTVKKVFPFSLTALYQVRSLNKDQGPLDFNDRFVSPNEWAVAETVISFESEDNHPVGLVVTVDNTPLDEVRGCIYGAILILALYVIIVWEVADRILCTLLITTASLAILALLGNKPSFDMVISWVDFETLMLPMGNMIMTSLMGETGFFDYAALVSYRISRGHPWLLIALLSAVVSMLSVFLDNATVVLLTCPTVIRFCEVMDIRTTLVLIMVAIYANIGGSITPVGGSPNIIIATNKLVESSGINFFSFSLHMLPTALICLLVVYGMLYMTLGKKIFILDEKQLELAKSRQKETPSGDIEHRAEELRRMYSGRRWLQPVDNFFETLATMEASYGIRKKMLLVYTLLAICFAAVCLILQSYPQTVPGASLGWIAILAAFLLLILADKRTLYRTLSRIEWGVMLLLASLLVLTEVVGELGLIAWLGDKAVIVVEQVDEEYQNMVGMLLVLWLSALLSAFIHNTMVASIMVKISIEMAYNDKVVVRLISLVWATSCGSCYGANGTLLGSMANEFTAAVGRAHGYELSFRQFFLLGFPIMIVTLIICSFFLMMASSLFSWTVSS